MDTTTNKLDQVKDYLQAVVAPLCEFPMDLDIVTEIDEKGALIKLYANKTDLGRLIGKKGETANAMRSLLRALGAKNDARYSLKIDDQHQVSDKSTVMSIE